MKKSFFIFFQKITQKFFVGLVYQITPSVLKAKLTKFSFGEEKSVIRRLTLFSF